MPMSIAICSVTGSRTGKPILPSHFRRLLSYVCISDTLKRCAVARWIASMGFNDGSLKPLAVHAEVRGALDRSEAARDLAALPE
jgi:hypothetical protein